VRRNPKKGYGDVLSCTQSLFDIINYVIALVIPIVADGVEGALGIAENDYAIMVIVSSK